MCKELWSKAKLCLTSIVVLCHNLTWHVRGEISRLESLWQQLGLERFFCLIIGALFTFVFKPSEASITNNDLSVFTATGVNNNTQLARLWNIAGNWTTGNHNATTVRSAASGVPGAADTANPSRFKLFTNNSNSTPTNISAFTQASWDIVNITYVGSVPEFTFLMSAPYVAMGMAASNVNITYNNSLVRANLLAIENWIVGNTGITFVSHGTLATNHRMWIPSDAELTQANWSGAATNVGASYWVRTDWVGNVSSGNEAAQNHWHHRTATGTAGGSVWSATSHGNRPAIRIRIPAATPPVVNHTVTFNANGGSPTPPAQTVENGNRATAPSNPTRDGHRFLHWSLQGQTTSYSFTSAVTGNITLVAQWQRTWTVEYRVPTHPTLAPATVTVDDNARIASAPTAPTLANNSFHGWFIGSQTGTAFVFSSSTGTRVTANTILFGRFRATVTFNAQSGSPTPASQTVDWNTAATTPTQPTRANHDFGGWWTQPGGAGTQWNFANQVTQNTTLHAHWTLQQHQVRFFIDGNLISGNGPGQGTQTIAHGSTIVTAPTVSDTTTHTFGGWDRNLSTAITGATNINAIMNPRSFQVTFSAQGGTPAPGVQNIVWNTHATQPTQPSLSGYTFAGWRTEATPLGQATGNGTL
jgi:uncharacterized repeat protein (TIGR02543 family)